LKRFDKHRDFEVWPLPENVGLKVDRDDGLRVTAVEPGSAADKAGIKAGDIIVEFAGKPIKDLYAYTDALYAQKPGDTVDVVVLRGTERLTLKVTLGRRGS
jgi:S1-C subfamily serine protease